MGIEYIGGGICAAQGFTASGIHCGIRKNRTKRDLALIISDRPAHAAGIYTTNLVKGAPIYVTQENIADGFAQAIICNSGNANTCAEGGMDIARGMCGLVAQHTGVSKNDVIVASTGVIGQKLDISPIENGMEQLVAGLSRDGDTAAQAIMTTDTIEKICAVEFMLGNKTCRLGGIAKGSGMIHPNMATMLVFLTTDAAISSEMLHAALLRDADETFHMISVDGDTSTNDTLAIMANGAAGNAEITSDGEDFEIFTTALNMVTRRLCRLIAKDGEGATKLLECMAFGAHDAKTAKTVAKSVICSALFKSAMFGEDANWGRALCAIGYSGADVDINKIDVSFASSHGRVDVCTGGVGIDFSEESAKKVLSADEIQILVGLNSGEHSATAWGCDLTYDYVKINGDYRT